MSNWTPLTIDDLKAVAFGGIIDAARASAAGTPTIPWLKPSPMLCAAVRGAISTGNTLDQDTATIPAQPAPVGGAHGRVSR